MVNSYFSLSLSPVAIAGYGALQNPNYSEFFNLNPDSLKGLFSVDNGKSYLSALGNSLYLLELFNNNIYGGTEWANLAYSSYSKSDAAKAPKAPAKTESNSDFLVLKKLTKQENWRQFKEGMGEFLKNGALTALASTGKAGQAAVGAIHVGDAIANFSKASKAAKDAGTALSGAAKVGGIAGIAGAAADVLGMFMPDRAEYSGKRGNITLTMDTAYDTISSAAMAFGPAGLIVGGAMKVGSALGKGIGALGGSTDGMCVCAGTKVVKANGEICNVEDLRQEDGIIGWDGKKVAIETISTLLDPAYKECIKLVFEDSTILCCSIDHPILVFYNNFLGYKAANNLLLNDKVGKIINIENSELKLIKLVKVTYIGKQLVYNLLADEDHTYLANGIITHNTTTDAILGSSFFNLTPLGLINGFGGKRANTITKDEDAFELVGSSYSGTTNKVNEALTMSGKKYGAFSNGARKSANRKIAEATRQQNIMSDIAEETQNRNDIASYMSSMGANAYDLLLNGGYSQRNVAVGKLGMSFKKAREIVQRMLQGAKIENSPKEILEESELFPVKFEDLEEEITTFKEGGEILEESELFPVKVEDLEEDDVEFLKQGGSVNVIPEGALHARKHNMGIEGITKKGIPVVSEDEEGNIEQHAEIERAEIILRLELTKKLEELFKAFYKEDSSQKDKDNSALEAGKLLVQEIIYNTIDNTKELL